MESCSEIKGAKSSSSPVFSHNLFMIRHGHYYANITGENNQVLTPIGEEQALLTGERLRNMDLNYTKIVHSMSSQAIETSAIIENYLPDVEVEFTDILNKGIPVLPEPPLASLEVDAEMCSRDKKRLEEAFEMFFSCPDSPSASDTYQILICHSTVIRYFICRILQIDIASWGRFSLSHCSISWVRILRNGAYIVKSVGSNGHLPGTKLTY